MIRRLDTGLLLAIIALMGVGLVQVYSSSYIFAIESFGNGLFFFQRQFVFSIAAFIILIAVAFCPWRVIEKWGWTLWALSAVLILMTFIPGFGVRVGGAIRWLQLPMGVRFEPSELLKIAFCLLFATYYCQRMEKLEGFEWPVKLATFAIPMLMLLKQPDFGSFALIICVGLSLLFAFGLKWRYIIASVSVALPAFYFLVMSVPYRRARVLGFLDPWADPESKGFQIIQSMLSFHSGGITGAGLGQGQGKLFFLPEAHTDFTLAVLGEEMGFIGFLVIMCLYGYLVFKGFQIATRTQNQFRKALALGLTLTLALTVFINVGVVMGILPTKGLTLPFLSYGGSSLITKSLMLGLLLAIERADREEKGKISTHFQAKWSSR